MAFGQQAGPPATAKQMEALLALVHDAGHRDFRDARGPLGFNQRQAGGRFTRDEASAFIGQLQDEGHVAPPAETALTAPPTATRSAALFPKKQALGHVPADLLAAELRRRGGTVTEP